MVARVVRSLRAVRAAFFIYKYLKRVSSMSSLPYGHLVPELQCLLTCTTSIRCPYDIQITVSVRPPQGDLAIIIRIYGHRGLYDFV